MSKHVNNPKKSLSLLKLIVKGGTFASSVNQKVNLLNDFFQPSVFSQSKYQGKSYSTLKHRP